MRKQVDFDVRVFPLGSSGNQGDFMTREQVSQFIRDNYLSLNDGWEVMSAGQIQITGNVIMFQVVLVKWQEADQSAANVKAKVSD